jgi:hypothetical protein
MQPLKDTLLNLLKRADPAATQQQLADSVDQIKATIPQGAQETMQLGDLAYSPRPEPMMAATGDEGFEEPSAEQLESWAAMENNAAAGQQSDESVVSASSYTQCAANMLALCSRDQIEM